MAESKVQLQAEGSGPAVRTIKLTRVLADGTLLDEEHQVVRLADERGDPIDLDELIRGSEQLAVLKDIRALLLLIARDQLNTTGIDLVAARALAGEA